MEPTDLDDSATALGSNGRINALPALITPDRSRSGRKCDKRLLRLGGITWDLGGLSGDSRFYGSNNVLKNTGDLKRASRLCERCG